MCYNVSYFYNLGGLNVSLHKDFVSLHKSRLNIFRRVFTSLSRFCMFTGIFPIGGLFNFRKCPKAKLNCTNISHTFMLHDLLARMHLLKVPPHAARFLWFVIA